MNKYYLDVITGGSNKGGIVNYVIEASGYKVNHDSYIFYKGEYGAPSIVAVFPVERTIIGNIESEIQDEPTN